MTLLFLILAAGAGLLAVPGRGRTAADRRVAQLAAVWLVAAALFTLRLVPLGLILIVIGIGLFGISLVRDRALHDGFQDLNEDTPRRPRPRAPSRGVVMSRDEALAVLGLPGDADADAVRTAHRRMIARAHPDAGGSDYLAAQVNAARAVLLDE